MINKHFSSVLLTVLIVVTGCTTTPYKSDKTSLELQAMQRKEFETTKPIGFRSTLSVFQDLGYIIEEADIETGLITCDSPKTKSTGFGVIISADRRATAFIEELPNGKTSIRLNFVDRREESGTYGAHAEKITPIEDPAVYTEAFAKIQEAIFIRTATE